MLKAFCELCEKETPEQLKGIIWNSDRTQTFKYRVTFQQMDDDEPVHICADCLEAAMQQEQEQPAQEFKISGGVDIPTMQMMHPVQYRHHLENDGGFWLDHHDIVRSSATGRPLATSKEQADILREELDKVLREAERMWTAA